MIDIKYPQIAIVKAHEIKIYCCKFYIPAARIEKSFCIEVLSCRNYPSSKSVICSK